MLLPLSPTSARPGTGHGGTCNPTGPRLRTAEGGTPRESGQRKPSVRVQTQGRPCCDLQTPHPAGDGSCPRSVPRPGPPETWGLQGRKHPASSHCTCPAASGTTAPWPAVPASLAALRPSGTLRGHSPLFLLRIFPRLGLPADFPWFSRLLSRSMLNSSFFWPVCVLTHITLLHDG